MGEDDSRILEHEDELNSGYKDEQSVYPMKNIKIDKGFYSVFELKRKYDYSNKKIILDSSFQRENVWTTKQKSELIESVLMGLPLPIFYFNQDKFANLIVIDGRQRLTALFEFLGGNFSLNNLKILPEYNGKKFDDLDPIEQSKIEDFQIQAHVILPPTQDRIKFDIFDRVNRAGTQLNKQEIRNAIHQGKSTDLLNCLSESDSFQKCTGNAFKNEKRMKDKYIILRFVSFYLYFNNYLQNDEDNYEYRNDMDDLLAKAMDYINKSKDDIVKKLYDMMIIGFDNSWFYLGENGFRIYKSDGKKSPINMNLFETIMYIMYQIPIKKDVIKKYVEEKVNLMIENVDFLDSIGNHRDSKLKIETRFNIANVIVKEISEYANTVSC